MVEPLIDGNGDMKRFAYMAHNETAARRLARDIKEQWHGYFVADNGAIARGDDWEARVYTPQTPLESVKGLRFAGYSLGPWFDTPIGRELLLNTR